MKTILTTVFVAFLAITTSAVATDAPKHTKSASVTQSSCFNYFRAHRQAQGVGMSWAVNASDVVSFIIERSYDGEYYEDAGVMGCSGGMQHRFVDSDVFPGIIYYRIQAVKADGTKECSAVESVRIVRRG